VHLLCFWAVRQRKKLKGTLVYIIVGTWTPIIRFLHLCQEKKTGLIIPSPLHSSRRLFRAGVGKLSRAFVVVDSAFLHSRESPNTQSRFDRLLWPRFRLYPNAILSRFTAMSKQGKVRNFISCRNTQGLPAWRFRVLHCPAGSREKMQSGTSFFDTHATIPHHHGIHTKRTQAKRVVPHYTPLPSPKTSLNISHATHTIDHPPPTETISSSIPSAYNTNVHKHRGGGHEAEPRGGGAERERRW